MELVFNGEEERIAQSSELKLLNKMFYFPLISSLLSPPNFLASFFSSH